MAEDETRSEFIFFIPRIQYTEAPKRQGPVLLFEVGICLILKESIKLLVVFVTQLHVVPALDEKYFCMTFSSTCSSWVARQAPENLSFADTPTLL